MSQSNYDDLLPEIVAVPESERKKPNMPIEKYVQEATNLGVWCAVDRPQLEAVGVHPSTFNTLEKRIGALRFAQSLWAKQRHTREEAQQEWIEQEPVAYGLKNQLEHTYRFAFRSRPDLLNKVKTIEAGSGNADLLQDLSDLAVLGEANLELLAAINFDVKLLQDATSLSSSMSIILAEATGEKAESSDARIIRDQAYTYLKASVDEIREAGKFVFWKDEKRSRGYLSFHHK